MKLSFSTLGCPKLNFREILAISKDLGYRGVEIRGIGNTIDAPDIAEFSPENQAATSKHLTDFGVQIAILTSACFAHRIDFDLEMGKRYARTAALMGVPYIRVLSDTGPKPEERIDFDLVVTNLKAICEYANKLGVMVLTETNGFFADTAELKRLVCAVGEDKLGVIWDINHPFRFADESPEQTFENIGTFVHHVHIKDSQTTQGGFKYSMIGYGDLPIEKCVTLLQNSGYDGYFSLEWVKRWNAELEEPGIAFAQYAYYMGSIS